MTQHKRRTVAQAEAAAWTRGEATLFVIASSMGLWTVIIYAIRAII